MRKPPHNIEAEQAILGAMLLNNEVYFRVNTIISQADFFDPVHADIFALCADKIIKEQLASPVTLKLAMDSHEGLKQLGGPAYLARMAGASISIFACVDYAKLIQELAEKRKLLETLSEATERIYSDEVDSTAVIGGLEASFLDAGTSEHVNLVSIGDAVSKAAEKATEVYQSDSLPGASCGIDAIDLKTGGFMPGDFIVIGGRPSMGKTALALSMGLGTARSGRGVAFASLEMTSDSMALRAMSEASQRRGTPAPYHGARMGSLNESQMEGFIRAGMDMHNLPMKIIPPTCRDIGGIYSAARKAKRLFDDAGTPMGALIVDYLQLVKSNARSRIEQITEISMGLKQLAMTLDVPVIALSQLSRAVENRDDKRPVMSDLRESGQIEQDADVIMFCYRDEYYLEREQPDEMDLEATAQWQDAMRAARGKMEVIIAKQRMGSIGTCRMHFNAACNYIGGAA